MTNHQDDYESMEAAALVLSREEQRRLRDTLDRALDVSLESAEQVMDYFADMQGWDDDTALDVLYRFIDDTGKVRHLEDFVRKCAQETVAAYGSVRE